MEEGEGMSNRLNPVTLANSKAREVWAYINSGNVEVYYRKHGDGHTQHVTLYKSEVRRLARFCKAAKP